MNFLKEVWAGYGPYLVKFTTNFAVCGTLWLFLYAFKLLTTRLPVVDWAGKFIVHLHSAGIVAIFGLFVLMSANDILRIIRRGGNLCFA